MDVLVLWLVLWMLSVNVDDRCAIVAYGVLKVDAVEVEGGG